MTRLNSKGQGIVEILVATGVLVSSSMGLVWSLNALSKVNTKVSLVSGVTAAEAALVDSLLDESNYTDGPVQVKTSLRNGTLPANWVFNPTGTSMGAAFTFSISPNSTVTLNHSLQTCTGYPSSDCVIQIQLGIQKTDVGVDHLWSFAYRILTADPSVSFNYTGAGSTGTAGFGPNDYKIQVPTEYYLQTMVMSCPPDSVAIHGINPLNNQVTCISQPQAANACPNGTLPKSLTYNSTTNSYEYSCGPAAKEAKCPPNYYLSVLDTKTLDAGSSLNGTCIFAGTKEATSSWGAAKRIVGKVCPTGYKSHSSCVIASHTEKAGLCPWCSAYGANCSAKVGPIQAPISHYTLTIPYMCTNTTPLPMPANPDKAVMVSENSPEGWVDCRLEKAAQNCGATSDSNVQVNIACTLDTETVPATN